MTGLGWWAISGDVLLDALNRAHDGADPGVLYAELYANAGTETVGADPFPPAFGEPITEWWRWFAWRPVWTVDRGRVWFRRVHRRRIAKHSYLSGGDDFWFQHAVNVGGV